ncbi:hypothetical protein V6N12_018566 [Hibiscus sabdariffa]|uniref:Uncharacterized protein n=1 Tax=Hibiscus sabdariffa TaxID=183260 RepID=A0ABR2BY88_9ROSI
MEALGDLKTYGTFNQSAPLDRLVGAKKIYSIDLKAATDRWPLLIQLDLLKSLFGHEFADEVGNLLGFTIKKTGICKSKSTDTDYRSCPLANSNSDPKADSGHRGRLARAQKGRPETASKAFANFPSQAELWELSTPFPWSPNPLRLNGDAQGHSAFPEFLRPLAYGSGQAVLPFTLFEGLNSRDEKKGEWEIVRKLSIRSNSICRIREPLVKNGSLYTLQQKRLLTESHPSLPSFSSQDNEAYAQQRYRSSKQTSGILYPTRREMQRALARFGLRAYACFTRAMMMRVTKALGLSSWSCLLGVCCFPCLSLLAIKPSRKH